MPRVRGKPTSGPGKKVISLRDVRLAGIEGHVIRIKARVPTFIPEKLFVLAAQNGCVDYSPEMVKAFAHALSDLEGTAEEAQYDPTQVLREAVRNVMLFGDPEHFTTSGVPKVMAVRKAVESEGDSVEIPITKELVYDIYTQLEGNESAPNPVTLPSEEARYPEGADLQDADGIRASADVETSSELTAELARATAAASGDGDSLEE